VLIDYQNEMFEVIRSETNADLVELHVRLLAKTAKAFGLPIVLSTVGVGFGFNGPTLPSILAELDGIEPIDRSSMNAFEDDAFRAAVEATRGNRGLTTMVDREAAVIIAISYWDELERPSAAELTRARQTAVAAAAGDLAAERYVPALADRASIPAPGSAVRLVRVQIAPSRGAGAVEYLRDEVLSRFRVSDRLSRHVAGLTRHHLRLGFLVHETPLSRHHIYRYLHVCQPVEVDVSLLSVADRLATRGRGSDEAISAHLKLAGQLLAEGLDWAERPPRAPIRGDALAAALNIEPGPQLGAILAELQEAAFAAARPSAGSDRPAPGERAGQRSGPAAGAPSRLP